MGAIYLKYKIETENNVKDMGNVIPPWGNNFELHKSYKDSDNTWFFVNNTHSKDYSHNKVYIQYGQNSSGWANISYFTFVLDVTEFTDHYAIVNFYPEVYNTRTTDYSQGGMRVHSSMTIATYNRNPYAQKTVFEEDTMTGKTGNHSFGKNYGYSDKLNITPGNSRDYSNYIIQKISYYPDRDDTGSITFYFKPYFDVDIKTFYVPMGIRIDGAYKSIESFGEKGLIHTRYSMTEDRTEKEDYDTENEENAGHYRYRKNDSWRQIPEFKI